MAALLPAGVRVALIGDSHMQALGPRLERLLSSSGVSVVRVEARPGESTRAYLSSGALPSLARGADVVLVELGGNDASAGIDAARHAADVQTAIDVLRPARVVWVGPGVTLRADLEARRAPLRPAQKAVVERAGGAWLDARAMTQTSDLRDDQVHFSAAGYDRWARALAAQLTQSGLARVFAPGSGVPWWIGPAAVGVAGLLAIGAYEWYRRR